MQVDIEHPANAHAKVPLVANPIRFSEHPIAYDRPPPLLGEHTRQVLHGVLGLSEGEVQTLSDAGVL